MSGFAILGWTGCASRNLRFVVIGNSTCASTANAAAVGSLAGVGFGAYSPQVVLEPCEHVVRDATEEGVLRPAAQHAAEAHNFKEITPDLTAKGKSKIRTEQ